MRAPTAPRRKPSLVTSLRDARAAATKDAEARGWPGQTRTVGQQRRPLVRPGIDKVQSRDVLRGWKETAPAGTGVSPACLRQLSSHNPDEVCMELSRRRVRDPARCFPLLKRDDERSLSGWRRGGARHRPSVAAQSVLKQPAGPQRGARRRLLLRAKGCLGRGRGRGRVTTVNSHPAAAPSQPGPATPPPARLTQGQY